MIKPQAVDNRALAHGLRPLLNPILRAYALGFASSTTPRVLTLLLTHLSKRRRKSVQHGTQDDFLASLIHILTQGLQVQRFATFCALLTGGSTILQIPLRGLLAKAFKEWPRHLRLRLSTYVSTFIAAWYSLKVLQSKNSAAFVDNVTVETATGPQVRPIHFAGRTLDLTLFAVTRALDVIIGELWSHRRSSRLRDGKWNKLDGLVSVFADPAIFASSCALIMWAWIYTPDRLPASYNKWINSAAAVDHRLLLALRKMRYGEIKYGETSNESTRFLEEMCTEYNWPLSYADPMQSIPFPCEMVHMGTGKSCEYHTLLRLFRSFKWAFSTYLPLNLLLALRNPSRKAFTHALVSSARSSAFLGSFISLFFYGVCLARNRLGPRLIGRSASAARQIDTGICVASGCALCGWSVAIEKAGRQKELGLFVAPRALATLLPRRYEMKDQWKENVAFALSVAVVVTCVNEKPERVRGVFGKLLRKVFVV